MHGNEVREKVRFHPLPSLLASVYPADIPADIPADNDGRLGEAGLDSRDACIRGVRRLGVAAGQLVHAAHARRQAHLPQRHRRAPGGHVLRVGWRPGTASAWDARQGAAVARGPDARRLHRRVHLVGGHGWLRCLAGRVVHRLPGLPGRDHRREPARVRRGRHHRTGGGRPAQRGRLCQPQRRKEGGHGARGARRAAGGHGEPHR